MSSHCCKEQLANFVLHKLNANFKFYRDMLYIYNSIQTFFMFKEDIRVIDNQIYQLEDVQRSKFLYYSMTMI